MSKLDLLHQLLEETKMDLEQGKQFGPVEGDEPEIALAESRRTGQQP
jgi:hypothetical protein